MRTATVALKTLLDEWSPLSRIAVADLYTLTLVGGEVFRYSGYQTALSAPAPGTDSPLLAYVIGPRFKRTKTTLHIGTEVSELVIDLLVDENDTLGINATTITWQHAAWSGLFDGAYLELQRAYLKQDLSSISSFSVVGTITWFYGRISEVEVGRGKVTLHVKSTLDLLTVQMPRRLYQSSCTHVFGDTMCGFNRETLAVNKAATSGSTQSEIHVTGLTPSPTTLFDNGTLVSTSGLNNGFKRTIFAYQGGVFYFLKPFIFTVTVGDTFHILPGCDHTQTTCENVFNNLLRFGGFPYIPPPEDAI